MARVVHVNGDVYRSMIRHAESLYPEECCGVLIGQWNEISPQVTVGLPLDNIHDGPKSKAYELDPVGLLEADRHARRLRLNVLAIYHSRPDAGSYVSIADLEGSCPWYSFIVVSVRHGRADEVRSWQFTPDQKSWEEEDVICDE